MRGLCPEWLNVCTFPVASPLAQRGPSTRAASTLAATASGRPVSGDASTSDLGPHAANGQCVVRATKAWPKLDVSPAAGPDTGRRRSRSAYPQCGYMATRQPIHGSGWIKFQKVCQPSHRLTSQSFGVN